MKKTIIVCSIVFLFGMMNASAQKNSTIIYIGETEITIPSHIKDFEQLQLDSMDIPYNAMPPFDNVVTAFVDDGIYKNIYLQKGINDKINKFTLIGYFRCWSLDNITSNQFIQTKIDNINTLTRNKNEINSLINSFFKDSTTLYDYHNSDFPKNIGVVYENKNAFGTLCANHLILESGNLKLTGVLSFILVKDKIVSLMVYQIYDDKWNLKWLTQTSEAWAKAILEANK